MAEFEQIVRVAGGFDRRDPDPDKNYGIAACRIFFILKGPEGAVQFVIGTDWYPPSVQREKRAWRQDFDTRFDTIKPEGWDVGYHAKQAQYEGQSSMDCDLIEGGQCFYDGSSLYADSWIEDFISGGTDWLWPRLEQEYRERFPTTPGGEHE